MSIRTPQQERIHLQPGKEKKLLSTVLNQFTIKRVYYVEGLNHNLFSVGQFCDADLEVAFRKSTCFIRDLKGNDLLAGSRGSDLYSISLQSTSAPNPICLMAKATSSQAWLWHRRLSHLNFDTINLLSKNDIVVGLPKLKFVKDHLSTSSQAWLWHHRLSYLNFDTINLLSRNDIVIGLPKLKFVKDHLCPSLIVDDYSRYTWTHFLRSKDETPEVLIDFLRLVQRGLHAQVRTVRTDKGTEFLNKTLHAYFASKGINHQTDGENLDKMKEKGDECIFVGYSTQSRAYRVFNKRTRTMASVQIGSDPVPECHTMALEHDSLSPGRKCQENVSHGDKTDTTSNELDLLFSPMFNELLNGSSKVVSKSSAVSGADAPNQCQQLTTPLNNHTTPAPTCQTPPIATTVISSENITQAEPHAKNDEVADNEFINIFSTPVQDQWETSSRHVDLSNMHTFYQCYPSEQRWT
nr:retrovirus-related Pol polyprotein from transposon TNT 1-94 [Tanacetum cinerariifolium]